MDAEITLLAEGFQMLQRMLADERFARERLEKLLYENQRKLMDLHDENVRLTARLNELRGHDREQDKGSLEGGSSDRRTNG